VTGVSGLGDASSGALSTTGIDLGNSGWESSITPRISFRFLTGRIGSRGVSFSRAEFFFAASGVTRFSLRGFESGGEPDLEGTTTLNADNDFLFLGVILRRAGNAILCGRSF